MDAHHFTLAALAVMGAWGALAAAVYALQAWRAARRVIGSRVRAPEWKARRLTNGRWIVERNRN